MASSRAQKRTKQSQSVQGCPPISPAAGPAAEELAEQREDADAADPGLDAEPRAGDGGPDQGGQVRAAQPEGGAGQDREGNAVLGPGVPGEQHRGQHDHIGERDGEHGLFPVHAERHQTGGEQPGRDVVGHADPQGREVVRRPGASLDRDRQQVVIGEAGIVGDVSVGEFDPARGGRTGYRVARGGRGRRWGGWGGWDGGGHGGRALRSGAVPCGAVRAVRVRTARGRVGRAGRQAGRPAVRPSGGEAVRR